VLAPTIASEGGHWLPVGEAIAVAAVIPDARAVLDNPAFFPAGYFLPLESNAFRRARAL
jgi:hypothetical protein